MTFTLYAYTFRSRAERVIGTFEALGVDYTLKRLDPFQGETRSPAFLDLNPGGKIPVLVHDDLVLTESVAIMEYLAHLYPEKGLIPSEPRAHGQYKEALFYGLNEIEPYLWIIDQDKRLPQYTWPEGCSDECTQRVLKALKKPEAWLQTRPFIAGDTFTLADIYYFQIFPWAKGHGYVLPEHVAAYRERIKTLYQTRP